MAIADAEEIDCDHSQFIMLTAMHFDVIIRDGLWFDGTGAPPQHRHLGIRAGKVAMVSHEPLSTADCDCVIDARGKWVLPGFIDVHTHYDAEILVSPGLPESVRHGVTSVILGSCSLSTIHSNALDCADLFSRVEAVPRDRVLAALEAVKTWNTAAGYIEYLESLPLGPNIAAFLGHSDIRTSVMGLGRADLVVVDPNGLDDSVDAYHEAPIEPFGGLVRMVNRSDSAVQTTLVGGQVVFKDGQIVGSGRTGRFLRAGESMGTVDERVLRRVA
jgi:N-acyl-D-aspartate/D-glutamate deacylase